MVLGAGFSKAIDHTLPLVDELGELVRTEVPEAFSGAPAKFAGGSFERWLSRIAEPQPDLDDASNLANARDFVLVTAAMRKVLVAVQDEVLCARVPWWLLKFVGAMHYAQSTVVTFNYDTLVEAVADGSPRYEQAMNMRAANVEAITDGFPPLMGRAYENGGSTETFRLLKLHGSLDTFWVRGDSTGTSIIRVPVGSWGLGLAPTRLRPNLDRLAPGRVPFIVPPASAKSAFFANPVTRQLWQTAAKRLGRCDEIALMGYSIPATDIVASHMLVAARAQRGAKVNIVNPDPEPVRRTLVDAGVPGAAISSYATCGAYADELDRRLGVDAMPVINSSLVDESLVAVAASGMQVRPVVGARGDGGVLWLQVGELQDMYGARDSRSWFTSSRLAAMIQSSSARYLAVDVDGEACSVVTSVPASPGVGVTVLVPTAVRFGC